MNLDFILKVKALAEQGIGGEKTNAEQLLQKLIAKHNITPEELETDTKESLYTLKYKGKQEELIAKQCAFKCLNKHTIQCIAYRGNLDIKCTKLQFIELTTLYDFYIKKYRKDLKTFALAFVHKNNLFPQTNESNNKSNPNPYTEEELQRLIQMMNGLEKHEYYKRIENKTN